MNYFTTEKHLYVNCLVEPPLSKFLDPPLGWGLGARLPAEPTIHKIPIT